MGLLAAQIEREHPRENEGIGAEVVGMLADTVAPVRMPLYVLLAAVVALLLIGCANLANLLLARALVRQRELAVRAALGAGRGRLVSQSIAEILPMLAAGGGLGVAAAAWAIKAVVPLLPADLPRAELRIGWLSSFAREPTSRRWDHPLRRRFGRSIRTSRCTTRVRLQP
jgi:hypothetical protein